MKLVYEATGLPVTVGEYTTTFRGERCQVIDIRPPTSPSSTGRVDLKIGEFTHEYFPGVINAKWINRDDR